MSGPQLDADRNLLLGILAVQLDFVERDQLIAAMNAWVLEKSRPLDEILAELGALAADEQALLAALVEKHLAKHDHDPEQSLAAVSTIGSLRQQLESIGDPLLSQTMCYVAEHDAAVDQNATESFGGSTSAGQRFHILRPHARGGLGIVSVALDDELHREVALKEIQEQRAHDPDSRARFLQEAEITGGLEHPGIVPVYGLGQYADGRPFYAMRFIRGDSLRDALRRFHGNASPSGDQTSDHHPSDARAQRTLEFRKLLARFIDVCEAIEYAHSRGVLHRDLKPGNIMLGKHGETLVVDWGLAKPVDKPDSDQPSAEPTLRPSGDTGSSPTRIGAAVGTPAYMSPEQAAGRLQQLGPASDVYSLGATLYCLLTGQPPFADHDTGSLLRRVQQGDFSRPRQLAADVPPALEAICLKAMANQPQDRYASPRQLAEEIERWLADEPVQAWREPARVRLARWVRRHRTMVSVTATAVLLLAASATAFGVLRWHQLELNRLQVEQHLARAETAAAADELDRAIGELSQAEGLSRQEPRLASLHAGVERHLEQLQRHRRFQALAAESLREGLHALRDEREPSDSLVETAQQALAAYQVLDDPQWAALPNDLLTEEQLVQTRSQIADLLNMLGIRLAMYDTADEAGRAATRRALGLFDRAAQVKSPSAGVWMARMLFHRRLDEDAQADAAGERMSRIAMAGEMTGTDYYLLGIMTLRVLKKPAESLDFFHRALAHEPNNYGAHWSLFAASRELNDLPGQIAALGACIALRPEEADLYYFRGFNHFAQRKYALAELDFQACVRRDPRHQNGHYWRGRSFVMRGDWAEAEREFTAALEIDPQFSSPRSWRAVAAAKLGRHEQAAADAEQSLELTPDDSVRWRCVRAYAQSVDAVNRPGEQPDAQRLAADYGGHAMGLLCALASNGYFELNQNLVSFLSDDLDPLRERDDFRQLIQACAEPIMSNPASARSPHLKLLRFEILVQRGETAAAAETAESMFQFAKRLALLDKQRGARELYNAACCYSRCVALATGTKSATAGHSPEAAGPPQEDAKASAARCRTRAVEVLSEAMRHGFADLELLETDADLAPLRDDGAFQALLERLRQSAQAEVTDVTAVSRRRNSPRGRG